MKLLWEQDIVRSLEEFKNGCISMQRGTWLVIERL